MAGDVNLPSGASMPRDAAEGYVMMTAAAAAALMYVAEPEKWPGFVAWVEQNAGSSGIPEGSEEPTRQLYLAWAGHMHKIAKAGERIVEGGM
jgi:hypothetical protein